MGRGCGGIITESLDPIRSSLARKASPDGFNGIGAPVGAMATHCAMSHGQWGKRIASDTGFSPHADTLELAQFGESIHADNCGQCKANNGDTTETEIVFFDEVLQVHSVESGEESSCSQTESANAELQVEKHEGVAIGIKDRFDSALG